MKMRNRRVKLVYCIHSLYNPGGMERVLLNKLKWLSANTDWELTVVTTDQHSRDTFFPFPEGVEMVDLGINYSDDNGRNPVAKTLGYLRRRRLHRRRLTEFLMEKRADIVVTLYPGESSFIPGIRDGSRKVMELHQNRFFHLQYNRKGLLGLSDRIRSAADVPMVRRFDKFVVLTREDKGYWGDIPNIEVIPNAALQESAALSDVSAKRVIAAGRLDYQKSFDRLIDAWAIFHSRPGCGEWTLEIFGQGEWEGMLNKKIRDLGLEGSARINAPVKELGAEYARSSILAMSSHYEGFPMVMIEGMACGLPVVSFDFKTGPKDIIRQGENGIAVPDGDIEAFADALALLATDNDLRRRMSAEAAKIKEEYSQERVMGMWMSLFEDMLK